MIMVTIPNKLINASYKMSLNAMRLRTLAFMRLTPIDYLIGAPPITISAEDWREVFIGSEQSYRDLMRAAKAFSKATVLFKGETKRVPFLDEVEYRSGAGNVVLYFNREFLLLCL
jgi:hypothetical protein